MSDTQLGSSDDASTGAPGGIDAVGVDGLVTVLRTPTVTPRVWDECARLLSVLMGDAAVVLALGYRRSGDAIFVASAGIDAVERQRYAQHYHACDPWVERIQGQPAGTVGFGYEWLPRWFLVDSDFCTEWLTPQGLQPTPCIRGVLFTDGTRPVATVGIFRRRRGRALGIQDVALMRTLMPHLRRAVCLDHQGHR
jgi:hypothetical protein